MVAPRCIMDRRPARGRVLTLGVGVGVAVVAGLLACQPEPEPEEPGEDCFMYQPPADSQDWAVRTLELGEFEGENFVPWQDGVAREAEVGFQGAFMLTPSFRVAREASDEAEACWFVRVDVGDPDRALEPLSGVYPGGFLFEPDAGFMRAGPLFHIVDESEIGLEQRMDVTVYGTDFTASGSVTYQLQ